MLSTEELAEWGRALETAERDLTTMRTYRAMDPNDRAVLSRTLATVQYSLAAIGRIERNGNAPWVERSPEEVERDQRRQGPRFVSN